MVLCGFLFFYVVNYVVPCVSVRFCISFSVVLCGSGRGGSLSSMLSSWFHVVLCGCLFFYVVKHVVPWGSLRFYNLVVLCSPV